MAFLQVPAMIIMMKVATVTTMTTVLPTLREQHIRQLQVVVL